MREVGRSGPRDGDGAEQATRARVLVVDDDPLIREALAAALDDEGLEPVTAPDGAAALARLGQQARAGEPPFAAILLDMRMPIMDGWAFAEAYRRLPAPRAPIVVLTAAQDAVGDLQHLGARAILAKPFDLDALLAIVDECVRDGRSGADPASDGRMADSAP